VTWEEQQYILASILAEQLEELGMSAAELGRKLKVPTNRITEILNGRRAVTGDTALRLGHFFGTGPEFWMNLQKLYELRLAENKLGKKSRICRYWASEKRNRRQSHWLSRRSHRP
jgi:antitoxin HigA-1